MTAPTNIQSYTQGSGTSGNNNVAVPIFSDRDPTEQDVNYLLGTRWINQADNSEFTLTSFSSIGGALTATWARLGSSSGALDSLTADGPDIILPTAGTITITGHQVSYRGVKTIRTIDEGSSTMGIEDLANVTTYVVGISSQEAVFTLIQDAIDQAITDGANSTDPAIIYIQAGTYYESITLSPYVHIAGLLSGVSGAVRIVGNVTCNIAGNVILQNIQFDTPSLIPTFSITGSSVCSVYIFNCSINGEDQSALYMNNVSASCVISTSSILATAGGKALNILAADDLTLQNTFVTSTDTPSSLTNGFFQIENSDVTDCYVLVGCQLNVINCIINAFNSTPVFNIDVNSLCYCLTTTIATNAMSIVGSGIFVFGNLTITEPGLSHTYDVDPALQIFPNIAWNGVEAYKTVTAADSPYSALTLDYFLGCTTTAAIAVDLPNPTTSGNAFIIKDISGTANANNITITATGTTIDGAASKVINTSYGSFSVFFNGTSYSVF